MIRHARRRRPLALPIMTLPVAMIESPFEASLMAAVGPTPLLQAGLPAALVAAIAMPPIAVRADVEDRLTRLPDAGPPPQNRLIMKRRVPSSSADGLDNGSRCMSG